jgi:phage FluMu gp28-like protein
MVKGRQEGLTFATTLRHLRRRLAKRGTTVWVSASQRQSREAVEYFKLHAAAMKEVFNSEQIDFPGTDDKAEMVTLRHNGARFVGMPANPDTMRGFSGDVGLDEFAFHRDSTKIWKAALAIASRGHQVEVISTPNGQQGKYWEIARQCGVPAVGGSERTQWTTGQWSIHWVDVYNAVKQGCPIDIAAMREVAGDEDTWMQEYCCIFLADAENYIPMELIVAAESELATLDIPAGFVSVGDLFLGIDIGRKKDRTVMWLIEKLADLLITRAVIVLERTPFRTQFEMACSLMDLGVRRGCVDSTGIGAQIGEDLVTRYGGRVEAVEFNIANKEAMATATKTHFENRTLRIPAANYIRRGCNAVKRYTSPTGHFRFDAERTEAGHADEFWGLALASAAAADSSPAAMASSDSRLPVGRDRGAMSQAMQQQNNQPELETAPEWGARVERDRRSLWAGR